MSSERQGLRTSNLVYGRRTTTRISHRRHDLRGQRSRSQGHVISLSRLANVMRPAAAYRVGRTRRPHFLLLSSFLAKVYLKKTAKQTTTKSEQENRRETAQCYESLKWYPCASPYWCCIVICKWRLLYHLFISEIKRGIGWISQFFHTPCILRRR